MMSLQIIQGKDDRKKFLSMSNNYELFLRTNKTKTNVNFLLVISIVKVTIYRKYKRL